MKPTNPMAQLKAWKENHSKQKQQETAQNRPQTAKKAETQSTTQEKPKMQQKAKMAVFKAYPQTNRQFYLMMSAVERCKADFPDDFHHKLQQAKESATIAKHLKQGLAEWQRLAQGGAVTAEGSKVLKNFMETTHYLANKFSRVANHINDVNEGNFDPVKDPTKENG